MQLHNAQIVVVKKAKKQNLNNLYQLHTLIISRSILLIKTIWKIWKLRLDFGI